MEALFDSLTPAQKAAFLNEPALAPPPGVHPQFSHPPNKNAMCYGIVVTGYALAVLGIIMRLYVRVFCARKMRLEDYLMIAALGLHSGFVSVVISLYIFPGAFVHQWNVRVKDTPVLLKGVNTASILYGLAIMLLKVAILLDWIHIFALSSTMRRKIYFTCIGNIVVTVLFYVACVLAEIWACNPRSKIWNQLEHGTCINTYTINIASCAINFALDLIMLAIPQQVIWRMTLSTQKKIAISTLFAVGIFGCACGALRIVYWVPFTNSQDKTYHVSGFALAGMGEITIGFLVLCTPTLPKLIDSTPLLHRLSTRMQSWIGLSGSSETSSKPNSRLGLPSWIRNQGQPAISRRRGSDVLFYTEALTQNNPSTQPMNAPLPITGTNEKEGSARDGCGADRITVQEV